MGHPKHPAFVHFPIAFTCLTGGLDAVYWASSQPATSALVGSVFKTLDIALQPSAFPILSYYSTILTLLFTLPTIATGAWELSPVIQRDGFSSKKAKAGVAHALINDVAAFATAYNWWTRSQQVGFTPSGTNVLLSTLLSVPTTLYAAYLGGALVYELGMGLSSGRAKKTQ